MTDADDTLELAEGAPSVPQEPDPVLAAAVDTARAAAEAAGAGSVGEHLGVRVDVPAVADPEARVVTHAFATTLPGYGGWHWTVTLARTPEAEDVTVDEVVLLPGEGALLAPAWVPWEERVRPGDLAPGDLLPGRPDDPRLVPGYLQSDDPAEEQVAFELGLGREQVLSRDGRLDAAIRWYSGDRGPDTSMARQAPASCGTCGFLLQLAGSLQAGFGVCANEVTDTDGAVVSVEYGCGAHSSVVAAPPAGDELPPVVWDDGDEITANEITANETASAEPASAPAETLPDETVPGEQQTDPAGGNG